MDQKEAIEKLTTLKNVIARLPECDEKRVAVPIVEEFLTLTQQNAPNSAPAPKREVKPEPVKTAAPTPPVGFEKTGDATPAVVVTEDEEKE